MFAITGGKGFQITFPNKITISVQFGPGNYCEHYDGDILAFMKDPPANHKSKDAEVALFTTGGRWLTREACRDCGIEDPGDDVMARVDADTVVLLIGWAAQQAAAS